MQRTPAASAASIAFVLLCSGLASAAEQSPRDLSGAYTARGVGVNGAKYEAKVTLTLNGDTYLIRWAFADGEFTGVGIVRDGVLSVGWSNHDKAGVVLYTLKEDGRVLDGIWADGSTNGHTYSETLTRRE